MTLEQVLRNAGANLDSQEWSFALKQVHLHVSVDETKMDCYGSYPCRFSQSTIRGSVIISERDGYVVGANGGILVICPAVNDMPVTIYLEKKVIRIAEAESKLLKFIVNVKTNDEVFTFRAPKKIGVDIEKLVNKVRNSI